MPIISTANANANVLGVGDTAGSNATFTIQNGRTLANALVGRIAGNATSTGQVTVTGTGSAWNFTGTNGYLYVGQYGTGTLNVLAGGAVTAKSVYVAEQGGSNGTINLSGNGSTFSAGSVTVGQGGTGTLQISNGATASFTGMTVGAVYNGTNSYGTGTATVSGSGSNLAMTGDLYVGWQSNGSLTLSNGATLNNNSAYIGRDIYGSSRTASVTINGADTTWTTRGVLWISSDSAVNQTANHSQATLTLNDGTVTATNGADIGYGLNTNGSIIQNGGTFALGSAGVLGFSNGASAYHLNGGVLKVGGTAGITSATGTHTFDLAGGTIQVTNSALTTSVKATFATATNTTFDTNGLGATWSGILSGNGALTKIGSGTLTLSGPNTYSGGTIVSAGTLALAASTGNSAVGTGALSIGTSAMLSGTGLISASSSTIQGTLAPGDAAIGTLNFTNALTLATTATLQLNLASASNYDQLILGSSFTASGTLTVDLLNGYAPTAGATFQLFDLTNPITGSFDTLNLATLSPGLSWDTSSLYSVGTLSVATSAVPEPSTYVAIAGATALLIAVARRRATQR